MLDTVIPSFWKSLKVRLVVDLQTVIILFICTTEKFPENDDETALNDDETTLKPNGTTVKNGNEISGPTILLLVVAVFVSLFSSLLLQHY